MRPCTWFNIQTGLQKKKKRIFYTIILDSKRSEECIDFTMICLCLCTRFWVEKVLGSLTSRRVSYRKLHVDGAFQRSFFLILLN